MGFFGGLIGAFQGSQGKGLGKDENLALLGMKVDKARAGISAMNQLTDYYKTGQWDGGEGKDPIFTAGESYGGKLGDYEMTGLEQQGQAQLSNMVQQGAPELNRMGANEITELMTTDKYNPLSSANQESMYKPLRNKIMDEYGTMSDQLDAAMSAQGDMYSSERANQQTSLANKAGQNMAELQAGQYEQYLGRLLGGAETAFNMGQAQQQMDLQRVEASMQYGALERMLADQQAQDAYSEWTRSRSEYGDLVNTAMQLYGGMDTAGTFDSTGAGSAYTRASTSSRLATWGGKIGDANYGTTEL